MTPCGRHTSACTGTDARPYRVFPTGTVSTLCAGCAAVLRAMGMDLREDVQPEWRRRLAGRDNTGEILAVVHAR